MITTGKILLTIHLEGGTLTRKSNPEFVSYEFKEQNYNKKTGKWTETGNTKKGISKHFGKEQKCCMLKTTISQYAYEYMISDEIPSFWNIGKKKLWKKLSSEERLKIHLNRSCQHHKGKFFTYEILED